jgi:hypothetical protein
MSTTASRVAARHLGAEQEEADPVQKETNAKKERYAALRVVARVQRRAFEFPSPEALKQYLHDHPGADKSKHTVAKPGDHAPAKEEAPQDKAKADEPKSEGHGDAKPKAKTSWKDLVKNLSEKAKSFVQKAPEHVKSFVHDEKFRRDALMKAHEAIVNAPEKFMKKVVHEAKHEAHEFHLAGKGVLAVVKGGKMSDEEKKAVKTVVTHIAITAVATALSGGLAGGAAAMLKGTAGSFLTGLAKKIVLKAVLDPLGHLPTLEEYHEIAHGSWHVLHHVMEHLASEETGKDNMSPEDTLQAYVAYAAAKGIKELSADTLSEALEDCAAE